MPRLADPALPERRRSQILEAARLCFRARGFRETTIEDICGEARISPGMLYRYFGSKTDIVTTIALETRASAEAAFGALNDNEALVDALAELAHGFLSAFDSDQALLPDIWAESARDPTLAQALRAGNMRASMALAEAIRRAQHGGGAYPTLNPEDAAEVLLAQLEGLALTRALGSADDIRAAVRRFRTLALLLLKPKR